jgi:hypothetical protein
MVKGSIMNDTNNRGLNPEMITNIHQLLNSGNNESDEVGLSTRVDTEILQRDGIAYSDLVIGFYDEVCDQVSNIGGYRVNESNRTLVKSICSNFLTLEGYKNKSAAIVTTDVPMSSVRNLCMRFDICIVRKLSAGSPPVFKIEASLLFRAKIKEVQQTESGRMTLFEDRDIQLKILQLVFPICE